MRETGLEGHEPVNVGQSLVNIPCELVVEDLIQCHQVVECSRLCVHREDDLVLPFLCFDVAHHSDPRQRAGGDHLSPVVRDVEHGQVHEVKRVGALNDGAVDGRSFVDAH